MKKVWEHLLIGVLGGLLYIGLEVLWRGHSHWTMFLLGGICFVSIGLLNEFWPGMPLIGQMAAGALIVSAAELVVGLIVNVWLSWNVWDYSYLPGNLWGQVSLPYAALWFLLSGVAAFAEDLMHDVIDWLGGRRAHRRKPQPHARKPH